MVIPSGPLAAIACVRGEGEIRGTVKFYPVECGTLIFAEITGLPAKETGFFGLHIHEGSQCAGTGYSAAGGHFDSVGRSHPGHAGDLPPLLSDNGRALLAVSTGRICVWDIIDRTVVIHSAADDFHSQPSGNAGRKIACGVIQRC